MDKDYAKLLKDGYIRFEIDAEPDIVFHFVRYNIEDVWGEFVDKDNTRFKTSYSKVEGFISPQEVTSNNNLTLAFKGKGES